MRRPSGAARRSFGSMVASIGIASVSMAPVFLIGATGTELAEEFGMTSGAIGVTVALFFLVTALTAAALGRASDRFGARASGATAVAISSLGLSSIALFVSSGPVFIIIFALTGLANALGGPTSAILLSQGVRRNRQGFAFGLRQAATPLSALVAGLSVPLLVAPYGWRSAFIAGALFSLTAGSSLLLVRVNVERGQQVHPVEDPVASAPPTAIDVRLYAVAFGLSIAAATSFTTFFVPASIASGLRPEVAGLALSTGSGIAVVMRVALGHFGDRAPRRIPGVMLKMIASGSAGYVLLASDIGGVSLTFVAALLAIGVGWSWTGLLFYLATQHARGSEGSANGVLQTGGAAGGMIGPVLVGVIIDAAGFRAAWLAALAMQTLALVLVAKGSGGQMWTLARTIRGWRSSRS